jgi:hypothetical protein
MTPEKVAIARRMYESGKHTVAATAGVLGVSHALSVLRNRALRNDPAQSTSS